MKRHKSPGPNVDPAQWYAEALTAKFKDESDYASKLFTVRPGIKYDAIMQRSPVGGGSIHCFVDKSGQVFKAQGLKKPAIGVRYLSVAEALVHADVYGRYLYLDYINEHVKKGTSR